MITFSKDELFVSVLPALQHFDLLAGGEVVHEDLSEGVRKGPAVLWFKAWARDSEAVGDMICDLADRLGFKLDGQVDAFNTDTGRDMPEDPEAYDIMLLPCQRSEDMFAEMRASLIKA